MTRLRWLDLLRSLALLGMIIYHAAYDLQTWYGWDLDVTHGLWKILQGAIASLFLMVSGISAGFWTQSPGSVRRGWQRGWTILSAAMLVSLVTAVVDPGTWVRFGILHLIAFASFLLPFLRALPLPLITLLGIVCLALTPFDLMPHMASVDYVPPIPWLGPILLGFAIGIPLAKRERSAPVVDRTVVHGPHPPFARLRVNSGVLLDVLALPGRASLWIYLLHQPVLLLVLWMVL